MAICKLWYTSLLIITFVQFVSCGVHPDGISEVSRFQDDLGNYEFGYKVSNRDGEHFRKEGTDALGRVVGSYGLTEADGRHRVVDYVADKNGFRAHVRSNEPGVVSSNAPAATVEKTGQDIPGSRLEIAASDSTGIAFGDRLKPTGSRITYTRPNPEEIPLRTQPLGPSDYSPGRIPTIERPRQPTRDFLPPGGYYPPLDPYAVRASDSFTPDSSRVQDRATTPPTRRPVTPQYGGYETQFPPVSPVGNEFNRYPGVSMSTGHGGSDQSSYLPAPQRPYEISQFPNSYPLPEQGVRATQYGRPVISGGRGSAGTRNPSLVLRTVPIPNGIQAVQVDPSTGQVFDTPEYPLYGQPEIRDNHEYGRGENRSLNTDSNYGNTGETIYRNFDRSQFPPYNVVPNYNTPLRGSQTHPRDSLNPSNGRDFNRNYIPPDEANLSRPTARDLAIISRAFGYGNEPLNRRYPVDATPQNRQTFNPVDTFPRNRSPFNPVDATPQNRPTFNPVDTFPRNRSPFNPVDATPQNRSPFDPVDAPPQNMPPFNGIQRDYAVRYPGYYGMTDINNPDYRNDFRHSSDPLQFNPYFGALPRTPIFQRFPDGYQYPEFDEPRNNNYRGYRSIDENNSKEDSEKDDGKLKEKDI